MTGTWITAGLILSIGAFLQSLTGLGFNLLAVPGLMIAGFGLPESVILATVSSTFQRVFMVHKLRKHVDWKKLRPVIAVGLLGLPLGLALMYQLSLLDPGQTRQIIGAFILLVLIVRFAFQIPPKDSLSLWSDLLTGFFAGLLMGLASIPGPAMVIWTLAHKWENKKLRVMPLAASVVFVPFQLVLIPVIFGLDIMIYALIAIAMLPAVLAGAHCGVEVGHRLPITALRRGMGVLLLFLALWLLVQPYCGLQ